MNKKQIPIQSQNNFHSLAAHTSPLTAEEAPPITSNRAIEYRNYSNKSAPLDGLVRLHNLYILIAHWPLQIT